MCHVLGDFLQEGCATKLADDLYCGGDTPQELIANWSRILDALARCNLRLSATKTVICPKTTTILARTCSQGSLSASPHRIAPALCSSPAETCRGECSASPRITSFLTTVSRYQVILQHLAGAADLPSDFASRNAPDCTEPNCQICSFVHELESSFVRGISTQEVLDNTKHLPFTSRPAWFSVQNECPDLWRFCAHLKQGTRPSKKLTNIRDVKRYLNVTSISKDGLLIIQHQQPLSHPIELMVIPRSVLDRLLTAIHIKLDHPSKHQLQMVIQHHFFALNMSAAIAQVSDSCHTCASLKKFSTSLTNQSSEDPPEVVGVSFAADIVKRCRQFILLLRECTTSYTSSCLVPDEKSDTLRDALAQLVVGLHPLDAPQAVIRVTLHPDLSR